MLYYASICYYAFRVYYAQNYASRIRQGLRGREVEGREGGRGEGGR